MAYALFNSPEDQLAYEAYFSREGQQALLDYMRQIKKDHYAQHPCLQCGETNAEKLTFHHRDPKQKKACIGQVWNFHHPQELRDEIAKCDVLCVTCHRALHRAEENSIGTKLWFKREREALAVHLM